VVSQPSADLEIQAKLRSLPPAPSSTGIRGCCTGFGHAHDLPNRTCSPS